VVTAHVSSIRTLEEPTPGVLAKSQVPVKVGLVSEIIFQFIAFAAAFCSVDA
jgi:hypothetical protein